MDLLTVHTRSAEGDTSEGVSRGLRVRTMLAAAVGPLVTGYAAVAAVLALVTAIASRAEFSATGVLLAAGPGWLAAYQVPLHIGGQPLGVLPLLPTLGVCLLVARTAATAAQRLRCTEPVRVVPLLGVIAGAHAAAGITISVLADGDALGVEPLAAFLVPALLSAGAATVGTARQCGLVAAVRDYLDPLALHGLRAGALGLAGLLAVGSLTLLVAMALALPTASELFARNAPGVGSATGMFLLSAGYLPNAVVLALGFATGPGFSLGTVSVSPFAFTGGPVPGVPLLAAVPETEAGWWPVLVLLPAAVGALVGWSLRRVHDDPLVRLRTVGVAGAVVGFGTVILGTFAGGRLGSGAFDPVSVPLGLVSIAAFGWIAVPGGLVAWFAGPHRRPAQAAAPAEATGEPAATVDAEDTEDTEDTENPDEQHEPEDATEAETSPEDGDPGDGEPEDDDFPDPDPEPEDDSESDTAVTGDGPDADEPEPEPEDDEPEDDEPGDDAEAEGDAEPDGDGKQA